MKMSVYSGKPVCLLKSGLFLLSSFILSISVIQAQTVYLSSFTNPTSKYSVSQPYCGISVLPPSVEDASNVSSYTLEDFASLSGSLITANLTCAGVYRVSATLNLNGLPSIPASPSNPYNAGFKVRLSNALLANLLGNGSNNIRLLTLLNGQEVESVGANAIGLSLLQSNVPGNISFTAIQPFNQVAIDLGAGILALGVLSGADYFYGFAGIGTVPIILPVKLTSFFAVPAAKNVAISWATSFESNASHYQLERSNDGGNTFSTIATIAAKGNSATENSYNYTDGTTLSGNYVYRLKIADKDGKAEYSQLVTIRIAGGSNWRIYPTLLGSGTNLNVVMASATGAKTQVLLTNLQGQMVRSSSIGTDAKAVVATSGLSAGVYIMKLYTNGQLQASEKVVIQ